MAGRLVKGPNGTLGHGSKTLAIEIDVGDEKARRFARAVAALADSSDIESYYLILDGVEMTKQDLKAGWDNNDLVGVSLSV
jgi:hypothetical protein